MNRTDSPWSRLPGSAHRASLAIGVLALGLILVGGVRPGALGVEPDLQRLLPFFFKNPFLGIVVAAGVWALSMAKERPDRIGETRFLTSLPLAARTIADHIFVSELRRYAWLPTVMVVLIVSLVPVAPLAYLCRLTVVSAGLYVLILELNNVVHLSLALLSGSPGPFPTRSHRLVATMLAAAYAIGIVGVVIRPSLISGMGFGFTVLGGTILIAGLLAVARRLYASWHATGFLYRRGEHELSVAPRSALHLITLFHRVPDLNPMLVRNLVAGWRAMTVTSALPAVAFFVLAYLAATNNAAMSDRASVLLGIYSLYVLVVAYRTAGRLTASTEPTGLLFSLPIPRRALYASVLLPSVTWLLMVASAYTVMLLVSGAGATIALTFFGRTAFVVFSLCVVAANCAITTLPDGQKAQTYLSYWLAALLLATPFAVRYFPQLVIALVALSFIRFPRITLYYRS